MSIVDLIDQAIDDCAVSDDAVRYNGPPPPAVPEPGTYTIRVHVEEIARWFGVPVRLLVASNRCHRLRRIHTAHPARWRKP